MTSRTHLEDVAGSLGFRPEVLEKVLKLVALLRRLDSDERTSGRWVMKGGTAINLFHLDLPRLSVDIDINFTGADSAAALAATRPDFERALVSICEREKCSVRRQPSEHAGGKFRLRFPSAFGGEQNLEVDVSYVARVPLFGVERREAIRELVAEPLSTPVLRLEELAAGKFLALLCRTEARDQFDAVRILDLCPEIFSDGQFRIAFTCGAAAARQDCRELGDDLAMLQEREVARRLLPLLRVRSGATHPSAAGLAAELGERLRTTTRHLTRWSESERAFLDRFLDNGEIEPALLTKDPELAIRISLQPMLLWKQIHIRRRLGLGKENAKP